MERISRRWRRYGQTTALAAVAALLIALAWIGAAASPASTSGPAVESAYPKKVLICHRSGKLKHSKYRTIRVSRRAVKGHVRRHGDAVGGCTRARFTRCQVKNGKRRTIRVNGARVDRKHLGHGDKIGACKHKKKRKR